MENASKAILVAGIILLVLVISTIIVNLYNIFRKSNIDITQRVDTSKIMYHNSQFTVYGKNDVEYSEVEKLIIYANNSNKAQDDFIVKINFFLTASKSIEINDVDEFREKNKDTMETFRVETQTNDVGAINQIDIYPN